MEYIIANIAYVSIIFLGYVLGIWIAHFLRKKISRYDKYLRASIGVIFILVIAAVITITKLEVLWFIIGLLIGSIVAKKAATYFYLGVAYAFAINTNKEVIVTSLVFLRGIGSGAREAIKQKFKKKALIRLIGKYLLHFLVGFAVVMIGINESVLSGVIVGGLIVKILKNR